MKTLNVTFTDEEYERVSKCKVANGDKNWHDFILLVTQMKDA